MSEYDRPLDEPAPEPGVEEAAAADAAPGDASDPGDAPPAPAEPGAEADDPVTALTRERDEFLDALRRVQAEFENYKKRMVRQQTEYLERAGEGLVVTLLPVLDAVDLARSHGASDDLEQVAGALLDVLGKEGLERIDPVGEPFDPTEHEAVQHEPGDGDEHVVSGLMRAGWRWRGRVLRPAMVMVKG